MPKRPLWFWTVDRRQIKLFIPPIEPNNRLINFRREVAREYVRQNLFSPYAGNNIGDIIGMLQNG